MKIVKSTDKNITLKISKDDADNLLELFGCFFNDTVQEILEPEVGIMDKVDAVNDTVDRLYDILDVYHDRGKQTRKLWKKAQHAHFFSDDWEVEE